MFLHPSVSHPIHRGRACLADTLPGQTPPGQTTPCQMATAVDGMYPTGIHSCIVKMFIMFTLQCNWDWHMGWCCWPMGSKTIFLTGLGTKHITSNNRKTDVNVVALVNRF